MIICPYLPLMELEGWRQAIETMARPERFELPTF
jgi:hypothetical protein